MSQASDVAQDTKGQTPVISSESVEGIGEYVKERDGRKFTNNPETTYQLPADETEFARLNAQHNAFLVGMEGLYPVPDLVEQVLEEKEGVTRKILDIGCGSGAWALAMAQKFPHAQVYGLDLVPAPAAKNDPPQNLHFEIGDINHGPRHFANEFDVVHMRCVGGGLPDYFKGITHTAQCLKEGGLLLVLDAEPRPCSEDMFSTQKMYTERQRDGSWLHRYLYEFISAYRENGHNTRAIDQGLWGHPLLEGCAAGSLFVPIGPWATGIDLEETHRLKTAGEFMRQNMKNLLHTVSLVMKKYDVPQEFLDQVMPKAKKELEDLTLHSWLRLRMFWGFRKGDTVPSDDPNREIRSNWKLNRQIYIHHSSEELQSAMQKWLDTAGEIPTSQILLARRRQRGATSE